MDHNKLYAIIIEKGFPTGSQVFFGEGQDYDYVVTESELGDEAMDFIDQSERGDYPDSSFESYKFIHNGDQINAIIVNSLKWKMRWMNTTSFVINFITSCDEETHKVMKNNKQIRLAMFAWFLYEDERLNAT